MTSSLICDKSARDNIPGAYKKRFRYYSRFDSVVGSMPFVQHDRQHQHEEGRGEQIRSLSSVSMLFDNCHVMDYSLSMIKTFADKETQNLFVTGKSKRIPPDLCRRAIRRLEFIHYANDINDLLVPPSNRLHALKGDRKGQHSISINDQWRICFRFIEGDAHDVEITDYH